MGKVLNELYEYRLVNLTTDPIHSVMIDSCFAAADEALQKDENFWPGFSEGVLRFAFLLMGDFPSHRRRTTGAKGDRHYALDTYRSLTYTQSASQKHHLLYAAEDFKMLPFNEPLWRVVGRFRDKHGYRASPRQLLAWLRKNYPEAYLRISQ